MPSEITKPLLLDVHRITLRIDGEEFEKLCQDNPDRSFELTATGELIVMPPVGGESGNSESELGADLVIWNRQTRLGKTFSSSTIFVLPNGARRSPDAAWVELSRWEALTPEQRTKFPPLAPDFVIELLSATDRLPPLREKMEEYTANGVRLGLLINPKNKQVEIYRQGQAPEIVESPTAIDCSEIMPGFILSLSEIW
ncbi:Uma2 family endonuclease [Chamaesiphon sp. GL140_3_metabinner_50]|uniref:Uma2 family endonuclease n=1 Tax=Chamaesiphon sp. GL140_3_metabinner_50 TaxID=2970812 RepID=UPI0025E89767|nr:Uma2 family endonuclease [Chamaesiphon sp. GL140_3_metabinner_50]